MGNTPSTASPRAQPPPPQTPPAAASRSRALKGKKRSIVDHPALLAAAAAATPAPAPAAPSPATTPTPTPRSAPIPIPSSAAPRAPPPRPTDSFSFAAAPSAELLPPRAEASTHRPIQYNSTRSFGAVRRGGVQGGGWRAPPRPAFVPEVVRSSIPLRIAERESGSESEDDGLVPTVIVWSGGGRDVFVAGTFDPLEWRARVRMRPDPQFGHTLTLHLAPGTYRLKFIVDDAWRCADTFPTATDDETGNLVNYVDIEDDSALDAAGATDEERQGRDARVMKAHRRRTYRARRWHPPQLPPSESDFWSENDTDAELEAVGWGRGRDGVLEKWTSAIPAPLIAAAQQEEARSVRAPPAPRLPRHLDKVILNTRPSSSAPPAGGKARGGGSRSRLGMTTLFPPGPWPPPAGSGAPASAPAGTSMSGGLEQWAPADDSSVLPVPSHVVLHHLGTSAIKNGVLAVSDTTRYDKKYITTIYYKPA